MSSATPTNNLATIEGLRFISALTIVAFHYVPYLFPDIPIDLQPTANLELAVDLFFVISGIVITRAYADRIASGADYINFMIRRVARIYPLHIATLGFYVLLGIAIKLGYFSAKDNERYRLDAILENFFLVQSWGVASGQAFNYVSWSISAEWFLYLTFPLTYMLMKRSMLRSFVIVALLIAGVVTFSERLFGHTIFDLTWNWGVVRALPSFVLGIWLANYGPQLLRVVGTTALELLFGLSLGVLLALLIATPETPLMLVTVYVFVASAYLMDISGRSTLFSARAFSGNGYLTYSIYMLHPLFATVFIAFLFPKLIGTGFWATSAAVAFATVGTLIAAWISFHLFEMPLRRLISAYSVTKEAHAKTKMTDAFTKLGFRDVQDDATGRSRSGPVVTVQRSSSSGDREPVAGQAV